MGTDITTATRYQNFRHSVKKLKGKSGEKKAKVKRKRKKERPPLYGRPAGYSTFRVCRLFVALKKQPCHVENSHGQQGADRNGEHPGP